MSRPTIPAGGLSPDRSRPIRPRYPFFLPVKVLSRVFRGKFLAGLRRLHRRQQLRCAGPAAALADPKQLRQLLRRVHRQHWVVYAKPAFGGPLKVLRYLGRYTHRIAISNHRLLAFDGERVTFRWKDYARGGKQRTMTLLATEFLRRFFLHVLPKGFVRIRYFGFLANRFRSHCLALCQQFLLAPVSSSCERSPTAVEFPRYSLPLALPALRNRHGDNPEAHFCGTRAVLLLRLFIMLRSSADPRRVFHTPTHSCAQFTTGAPLVATVKLLPPITQNELPTSARIQPNFRLCSPGHPQSSKYKSTIQFP